ncbi:zf-HC2 domain-containing protein [Brachyspira murdochii]|uniref:zf-HC2 domain-containing protein n=1 Tax=Brachyspira murdochii TaxID=84378 RepID=UPI0012F50091|nr:zf-HC2 domain-containing protein [Brachyspira murdochii]
MKNNHEYYEMLISRYKDNDLDSNEIFEMEKHLSSCKSCQKFKEELDSMSSILCGKKPIIVHKKKIFNKNKVIASIGSLAAALLIFAGVNSLYKEQSDDNSAIIANNSSSMKTVIDYNMSDEDYTPLSSYFSYSDEENTDEGSEEISIMSAYIYYMGK